MYRILKLDYYVRIMALLSRIPGLGGLWRASNQPRKSHKSMATIRLLTKLLLLLFAHVVWAAPAVAQDSRPNIVFILSDDHAVKAVSAYDASLTQTPNIDRIANNGMRFDRAYVANAICGPSRATLMTGMHSHANGFYSNEWSPPFDGSQQTLPSLLRGAGYRTAVVGKWHLFSEPIGFDHWEVIDNLMEQGSYFNPVFRNAEGKEETTGYVADLVTDKSIRWLDRGIGSEKPFFLFYSHKTPHRDWMPGPQELEDWDEAAQVPEPDTLFRDLDDALPVRREARMGIGEHMTDQDVKLSASFSLNDAQQQLWHDAFAKGNEEFERADLSADERTRWKYQRYVKTYLASVKSMDRQIGRLLDYLDSTGQMENTIVIYSSDQGFFLGENGWFDKRWMDEVSSRIPLLIQWNGEVQAGSHTDALVQNIDFAPTLLAVAGVEPETPMHGVSLLPLFSDPDAGWQRDLYYHFYENPGFHGVARHYGVRGERYKLVHYYQDDGWELFDLASDPDDLVNLYGQPGFDGIAADLKGRLAKLRRQYGVPDQDPEVPWYHGYLIRFIEWTMTLF